MQRAVEPAIGPARQIQPFQDGAVGAIDMEPNRAADRTIDRCRWHRCRDQVVVAGADADRRSAPGWLSRGPMRIGGAQPVPSRSANAAISGPFRNARGAAVSPLEPAENND